MATLIYNAHPIKEPLDHQHQLALQLARLKSQPTTTAVPSISGPQTIAQVTTSPTLAAPPVTAPLTTAPGVLSPPKKTNPLDIAIGKTNPQGGEVSSVANPFIDTVTPATTLPTTPGSIAGPNTQVPTTVLAGSGGTYGGGSGHSEDPIATPIREGPPQQVPGSVNGNNGTVVGDTGKAETPLTATELNQLDPNSDLQGDLNGDGTTDEADHLLAQQIIAQRRQNNVNQEKATLSARAQAGRYGLAGSGALTAQEGDIGNQFARSQSGFEATTLSQARQQAFDQKNAAAEAARKEQAFELALANYEVANKTDANGDGFIGAAPGMFTGDGSGGGGSGGGGSGGPLYDVDGNGLVNSDDQDILDSETTHQDITWDANGDGKVDPADTGYYMAVRYSTDHHGDFSHLPLRPQNSVSGAIQISGINTKTDEIIFYDPATDSLFRSPKA